MDSSAVGTVTLQLKSGADYTSKVVLNGQDVSAFTTRVRINVSVDDIPTAHLGLIATDGFDITLPDARCTIDVFVPNDMELVTTTQDGVTRYRSVPTMFQEEHRGA